MPVPGKVAVERPARVLSQTCHRANPGCENPHEDRARYSMGDEKQERNAQHANDENLDSGHCISLTLSCELMWLRPARAVLPRYCLQHLYYTTL